MNTIESAVIDLATKYFDNFKVRGSEVIAEFCPYCAGGENKDRGTFSVNTESGAFNCKRGSCNKKGSFKELCELYNDYEIGTIIKPKAFIKKNKEYIKPNENILKPITDEIVTYFARRKISKSTLDDFKICSDDNGNIVFPFYKESVLTYVKFRKPVKAQERDKKTPKEWQMSGTEPILFGMDNVSFNKPLIITEGQIDAMSLYEAGHHNVVSVPCGCENMVWLDNCKKWLDQFPKIILFGDNDEPGIRMVNLLTEELGKDRCMILHEYPELICGEKDYNRACKDANEILIAYGPEVLAEYVNKCEEAPIEGILNLADVPFIDPTTIPRIYTKMSSLDTMFGGFSEGSLCVISGKRGEGKSTVSGPFLLNAIEQGKACAAYSGELSSSKFLEWIMLQATDDEFIGITVDKNTGMKFARVPNDVQERIRKWINNKFYIFDNSICTKRSETEAVLECFKICARRYNCKIFLVD